MWIRNPTLMYRSSCMRNCCHCGRGAKAHFSMCTYHVVHYTRCALDYHCHSSLLRRTSNPSPSQRRGVQGKNKRHARNKGKRSAQTQSRRGRTPGDIRVVERG
ncbi:unnamed protein product, partial [Sphacelaria rigidula]